ncbi:MAG: transcriptional regulator [candidate division NC10 bacterium]|nr:transcriptional regulator [candidate division NC10 bacterium]
MPRGDQLTRQWRILVLLAARTGRAVPELMREVGGSRRTIWRDLGVLQAVGFPITTERDGRESRYRLLETARGLPPIPFNLPELLSLHLGGRFLAPLQATQFGAPIRTALDKIAATLAPDAREFLARLDREVSARDPAAKDYSRSGLALRAIHEAMGQRVTLGGEYHSFGRNVVTRRRLDPLHLWLQHGGLYLAAFCYRRRAVRTFAVERFRSLRLTQSTFEPPPDFDLERYLAGSFGLFRGRPIRVSLRLSAVVARFVAERTWHPTQTLAPLLDGGLELTLRAPLCPELRQWILGYGKEVEVLAPKSLRQAIRREWLAALRGAGGRVEAVRLGAGKPIRSYRPPASRPALAAAEEPPARAAISDRQAATRR